MPLSERKKPDPLSKSQVKRDMIALQELGEALIALPASQLEKIPLSDEVLEAIRFAHSLKADESRRRHLQYVGKLMSTIDPVAVQAALEGIKLTHKKNIARFHKIEELRDQLIVEGDAALQKFLEVNPQADRQHLRQLLRNAQQDRAKNKNSGAETELFKYLRELLQE